jgi:enoyl-CoA hydratase/carnithine racemase
MLTSTGDNLLSVRLDDAVVGPEIVGALDTVLTGAERDGIENLVLRFTAGAFPAWPAGPGRPDMRFFARWDAMLARLARLKIKTFAAYDGRVGAAAVQAGLVTDLRVASAGSRLSLGGLADGGFPGMGTYWLPKFVGLGTARRIALLGADLTADEAARLGLLDVVEDTVDAAVDASVKALRDVTPEAAALTRRLLDDAYLLEPGAAVELAKAARYRVGMEAESTVGSRPWPKP